MTEHDAKHAPKVAAIRAEAAGLLSGDGRRRLALHVESCPICAEHLRGARRFQALLGGSNVVPAFDGASAAQRAHIRSIRARRRALTAWTGLAMAAAAVVALGLVINRDPVTSPAPLAEAKPHAELSTPAARESAAQPMLAVEITALAGGASVRSAAGQARPITMTTQLVEGDVIETPLGAELDLALGAVSGLRIESSSTLHLTSLREHRVELRLEGGEVSSRVAPRTVDQSYEILAEDHRIVVRGTLFAVRLEQGAGAQGLSVQCDEGSVAILDAHGKTREVLRAPAHWSARSGLTGLTDAITRGREYRRVQPPYPPAADSALLTLPSVPGLTGWELGGQVHGAADLQMRVPRGQIDLTALLGHRRELVRLTVDPLGTRIAPGDLAFVRERLSEAEPTPLADAEDSAEAVGDASDVIRAGRPALQRCYERSLKNESNGSLSLRLAVVLDAQGRVRKVEPKLAEGAVGGAKRELPAALEQCIRSTVSGFRFAPPGGDGARIEAPLRFQLRR